MTTQKVVEIVSLPKGLNAPRFIGCSSPKCDGRPARWVFPQSPVHERFVLKQSGPTMRYHITACNNHLAAMAQIVETWHVAATPVPGTGCDDGD